MIPSSVRNAIESAALEYLAFFGHAVFDETVSLMSRGTFELPESSISGPGPVAPTRSVAPTLRGGDLVAEGDRARVPVTECRGYVWRLEPP